MKTILPIILILVSVGLLMTYMQPAWEDIKLLQKQDKEFDKALADIKLVEDMVRDIKKDYKLIPREDLDSLNTFLPAVVDEGRLLLDVDSLADIHRVTATAIDIIDSPAEEVTVMEGEEGAFYKTTTLQFEIVAEYENFIEFLRGIEQSLQLMDVTKLKIGASEISDMETYVIDITVYSFNK